jgi:hypothetical protein
MRDGLLLHVRCPVSDGWREHIGRFFFSIRDEMKHLLPPSPL